MNSHMTHALAEAHRNDLLRSAARPTGAAPTRRPRFDSILSLIRARRREATVGVSMVESPSQPA